MAKEWALPWEGRPVSKQRRVLSPQARWRWRGRRLLQQGQRWGYQRQRFWNRLGSACTVKRVNCSRSQEHTMILAIIPSSWASTSMVALSVSYGKVFQRPADNTRLYYLQSLGERRQTQISRPPASSRTRYHPLSWWGSLRAC